MISEGDKVNPVFNGYTEGVNDLNSVIYLIYIYINCCIVYR